MCGIVGWAFNRELSRTPGLIETAADTLQNRGPDASGYWHEEDYALVFGHRRLSVLELSDAGAQPMKSEDGRLITIFNGEIYNHEKLRSELEAAGSAPEHGWRGTSDTETLLAAINAWGLPRTLNAITGMFAFALWDRHTHTLNLARDRFGEKPMYVARIGEGIAFASELKALWQLPGFDKSINQGALSHFLGHGYVRAPASIFNGTVKLLPGSYVTLNPANSRSLSGTGDFLAPVRKFYWKLSEVAKKGLADPFTGSEDEAIDELDRVLTDSVRQQQISDVPLGAFLSGGIDSSAVVTMMQKSAKGRTKTFTIGFDEDQYDESKHAEKVAAHLGTDHTTVVMSPDEALNRVDRLPAIWDEPFADVSQLPTLLLSEVTSRGVTVALSGDGGDELFGGYERYAWTDSAWSSLRKIPLWLRNTASTGVRTIPPKAWDSAMRLFPEKHRNRLDGDRVHKLATMVRARSVEELYGNFVSSWKSDESLLQHGPQIQDLHWSGESEFPSIPETFMFKDAVDYMPDDVLVKVDRAAMSVSLETRAPFLDPDVAAFAWSLPLTMKWTPSIGKLTLRRLVHRYVPAELIERPKAGFAVPLDDWLRGPMRAWAEDFLTEEALSESGLNAKAIRRVWLAHLAGTENHRYFLWNVLTFQAWRAYWFK